MKAAMIRSFTALSALTLVLLLASHSLRAGSQQTVAPSSPTDAASVTVQQDVPYLLVNGTQLHLDVYRPSNQGTAIRPAIVLIHGGAWTSFDKSTMRGMGELLARDGFVAFAVDYRLFHGVENRWPAQLDDVQSAVRWVRANASKYGVNPDRIGAFGHSAGAQLAALLGMEDTRDNSNPALAKYSSKVQAVVDVSGPTDLTTQHDADYVAFVTSFLGADYKKHPEVWRDASPVFHVSKGDAPILILHGTRDGDVPISQAEEFSKKLEAAGVPVSFIKVDDGHLFQTPGGHKQLALQTLAFLNRYLVLPQ